ncbi:MAG: hypothetical protein IPK77_04510 [Cellvibrio sp.]|jgi:hypothetical protein|nr:hypothetical protein [Cellvibrio sp.]
MKSILHLLYAFIIFISLYSFYKRRVKAKREKYIDDYIFPVTIKKKLLETYPHLSDTEIFQIMLGLRQYFHICNMAGNHFVSMPSQVVDVAWHEFILFTRQYQQFCKTAFGRFLHHTPAEAMSGKTIAQDGIKRAWKLCCIREKIDPKFPNKLPLLFSLDKNLTIPNGFHYSRDCSKTGDSYCASHVGCGGGCGASSSCGSGNDSGSSCGSGCGGGD